MKIVLPLLYPTMVTILDVSASFYGLMDNKDRVTPQLGDKSSVGKIIQSDQRYNILISKMERRKENTPIRSLRSFLVTVRAPPRKNVRSDPVLCELTSILPYNHLPPSHQYHCPTTTK